MSFVDDYLHSLSAPNKAELERIRRIVRETVPEAEEVKTYGMPGFKYRGKYLASFAAFKDHLSFFPSSEPVAKLKDQLGAYTLSAGTIQFTSDHPLPEALVKQLLAIRAAAIDGA